MENDPPADFDPDPVLEAAIDRAVAPYVHMLTPEGLAESRRMLAVVLTTHPDAAPRLERLRAAAASGIVVRRDAAELAEKAKRRASAKGK